MAIRILGRGLLLTEKEIRCYQAARRYQRRYLLRELLHIDVYYFINGLRRLAWSTHWLVWLIQSMVVILAVPFVAVWYVGNKLIALLCFPWRFAKTYRLPKHLSAPGEKTLTGLHNAFSRHFDWGVIDYIDCLHAWVAILFGEDALQRYGLDGKLEEQLQRAGLTRKDLYTAHFSPAIRSLLSIYRENLSRKLGHYGRV